MPAVVPSKLWRNASVSEWQEMLDSVDAVVGKQDETLISRHRWYTEVLPSAIKARQPPHMLKDELVQLVEWKLTRGTWRPKLVDYAKAADPQVVVEATTAAFHTLTHADSDASKPSSSSKPSTAGTDSQAGEEGDDAQLGPSTSVVSTALEQLTKPLKGVGPATASLILAAFESSCPFMSDEAIAAACGSSKAEYTAKVYMRVVQTLREKAVELSKPATEGSHKRWTAVEVEDCLFVEALAHKQPKSSKTSAKATATAGGSGSKRKRAS